MPFRATAIARAGTAGVKPFEIAVLDSQQRHLRRKLIGLKNGDEVLVDLENPVQLKDRDCLVLEDGRLVEVIAADEDLMEVRAKTTQHLTKLAWHIGNRHLEAQIEEHRILIRPDHVIAHMLEHHGATVRRVREPFSPEHGAYHSHGHAHEH
jgi:urease accessory protein